MLGITSIAPEGVLRDALARRRSKGRFRISQGKAYADATDPAERHQLATLDPIDWASRRCVSRANLDDDCGQGRNPFLCSNERNVTDNCWSPKDLEERIA